MALFATYILWQWFSKLLQHTPPLLPSWTLSFYGTDVSKTSTVTNVSNGYLMCPSHPPHHTEGTNTTHSNCQISAETGIRAHACFHSVTSQTSQVSRISRETHTFGYYVTLTRIPLPDLMPSPGSLPKAMQTFYIQCSKLRAVRHILLHNICIGP